MRTIARHVSPPIIETPTGPIPRPASDRESAERRALRQIAQHPIGQTRAEVHLSAHRMQSIAIAALDQAGSLERPIVCATFREPSVMLDHEFDDYRPIDDAELRPLITPGRLHTLSPVASTPARQAPDALLARVLRFLPLRFRRDRAS